MQRHGRLGLGRRLRPVLVLLAVFRRKRRQAQRPSSTRLVLKLELEVPQPRAPQPPAVAALKPSADRSRRSRPRSLLHLAPNWWARWLQQEPLAATP